MELSAQRLVCSALICLNQKRQCYQAIGFWLSLLAFPTSPFGYSATCGLQNTHFCPFFFFSPKLCEQRVKDMSRSKTKSNKASPANRREVQAGCLNNLIVWPNKSHLKVGQRKSYFWAQRVRIVSD